MMFLEKEDFKKAECIEIYDHYNGLPLFYLSRVKGGYYVFYFLDKTEDTQLEYCIPISIREYLSFKKRNIREWLWSQVATDNVYVLTWSQDVEHIKNLEIEKASVSRCEEGFPSIDFYISKNGIVSMRTIPELSNLTEIEVSK